MTVLRHIVPYRRKDHGEGVMTAMKDRFESLRGQIPRLVKPETGAPAAYKARPFYGSVLEYARGVFERSVNCGFEVNR